MWRKNYTKSHFDESVDLLIRHYSDVLTYRVDVIVARVGKLATDLGEVGRRTNGRQRADARSCIATTILESMINQVKAKVPHKSEECPHTHGVRQRRPICRNGGSCSIKGSLYLPTGY